MDKLKYIVCGWLDEEGKQLYWSLKRHWPREPDEFTESQLKSLPAVATKVCAVVEGEKVFCISPADYKNGYLNQDKVISL